MLRVVGLKLAQLVPVMFVVSLASFFILELIPGDAAAVIAGPQATPENIANIREQLGLNDPIVERYLTWLGNVVTGDFGRSLLPPGRPVADLMRAVLPVTLQIAVMAIGLALLISIPAALVAANRPNQPPDRVLSTGAFAAISLPPFLAALLLIFFFVFETDLARWGILFTGVVAILYYANAARARAQRYPAGRHRHRYVLRTGSVFAVTTLALVALVVFLPDFPRQGFSRITGSAGLGANLRTAFLPALTLALTEAAVWMRLLRSDLMSTLQEDFILAARAKGMPRWRVLLTDALRPSSFSLITVLGVSLGRAVGGTVIVERIFNLPGVGTLMVQSIVGKDIPVVQIAVLLLASFYVLVNAGVDIAYGYLDPRIRRGRV